MTHDTAASGRYGLSVGQTFLEPLDSLRRLGRRAWLALLGIAVGCAAVVALLNIGHNAANEAVSMFRGLGSDILVVRFTPASQPHSGRAAPPLDSTALMASIPDLLHAAPLSLYSTTARFAGHAESVTVVGSTSDLAPALGLSLHQGRFLSPYDGHTTYAVLGANTARVLGREGRPVTLGNLIQLGNYFFEVVGVLAPAGANPLLPVTVDDAIVLAIDGMRRLDPMPQTSSIIARAKDPQRLTQTARALSSHLAPLAPGRDVEVQIPQQLLDGLASQARTFSYLLAGLGGISLLVGGVGVMNVMLMNVSERRREIGVRMALGARPQDIAWLFLLEAAVLSITGALAGAAAGLLAGYAFVWVSGWTFSLSAPSLPLGIVSSLLIGMFFGLHPALAAARLQPVEALRDD